MMKHWMPIAALASAMLCTPSHACSYAPANNSPFEIKKAAKEYYERAVVVADLELIEPIDWKSPKPRSCCRFARYKVIQSWKGGLPAGRLIRIPIARPCDTSISRKGDRRRVLLEVYGGYFSMDGGLNGARYDQSKFNREIDALVGHDRTPPSASSRSSAPKPRNSPENWLIEADYPNSAYRQGRSGTAGFKLTIGLDGRVTDCKITASTGHPDLDEATCRLIPIRARFTPAVKNGQPAVGTYVGKIPWHLPK